MIIQLPTDIIVDIFFHWIFLGDFCSLDSALTSSTLRAAFLAIVAEKIVISPGNAVDGALLQWLDKRRLFVERIDISGDFRISSVRPLQKLKKLDLWLDKPSTFKAIFKTVELEELTIPFEGINVIQAEPRIVNSLRKVSLTWSINPVYSDDQKYSKQIKSFVRNCSKLEVLCLSWIYLDNELISAMNENISLEIADCHFMDEDALKKACSRCTVLELERTIRCGDYEDEDVAEMLQNALKLHTLKLENIELEATSALPALIGQLTQLTSLHVTGVYHDCNISDMLSRNNSSTCLLKILHVPVWPPAFGYGETQLTDASLQLIAERCSLLEDLNVNYHSRVTVAGILTVTAYCTRLKRLSIARITPLIDKDLVAIARSCKERLELLDISHQAGLSNHALETVLHECRRLQRLHISYTAFTVEAFTAPHAKCMCRLQALEVNAAPFSMVDIRTLQLLIPRVQVYSYHKDVPVRLTRGMLLREERQQKLKERLSSLLPVAVLGVVIAAAFKLWS